VVYGQCTSCQILDAKVPEGLSARVFASTTFQPRGIVVSDGGDVLAVERAFSTPRIVRYV